MKKNHRFLKISLLDLNTNNIFIANERAIAIIQNYYTITIKYLSVENEIKTEELYKSDYEIVCVECKEE